MRNRAKFSKRPRSLFFLASMLVLVTLALSFAAACAPTAAPSAPAGKTTTGAATSDSFKGVSLNGAGATFPYPIYSKWFVEYAKATGAQINYQSIGSGGGIQQITQRTVDFGASDAPMTDDQLRAASAKLLHIPTVIGAVTVVYNLPNIPSGLKLTPEAVAGIFLGEITRWNEPPIALANPDVKLPDVAIVVVHRSDGSGTSNIFTDYLSSVSPSWSSKVGKGTSVNWPVGLGGKGNEGVAGQVKQTSGGIGYVELAYAVQNNLPYASIRNKSGKFIEPSIETTTAAAEGAEIPEDLRFSIVNPGSENGYPIAGATWLLVYEAQTNQVKGQVIADFLWWALHTGEGMAKDLLYAPLPAKLVSRAEGKVKSITYQGQPLLQGR